MLNVLRINHLYELKFDIPFDIINGIYKILAIYNYTDLLNNNIDIKKTYSTLSIDDTVFNNDISKFESSSFFKIVKMDDNYPDTVYIIPEFYITQEPNFSLVQCYSFGMATNLGTWKSKEEIQRIQSKIKDLVLNELGETVNPIIYVTKKLLMNETDYQTLESNRNANKETRTSSEIIKDLQNENANLESRNQTLEQLVCQIS